MPTLTIAVTQFGLRPERSVHDYLTHTEDLISRACKAGAELVVFPELASTGLLASLDDHEVTAETVSRDYWEHLAPLCDDIVAGHVAQAISAGVTILAGSHNRRHTDGTLRNTAFLIHPDGRVETQDKIHLTPPEHAMGTTGGDELLVSDVAGVPVGVLICADIQFPELSRHLVSRGVELILCPSLTWNRRGVHRVRTGSLARAMENQLFVAMSPLVGSSGLPTDAPLHAVGSPIVTGPVDRMFGANDGVLASRDDSAEGILLATLDRDLLHASRQSPETPGLALRRPDLYSKLDR